jgi:nitrile hydratase beta subunit
MNGVHDMGGMQSFGPVVEELNEPVFHHDWERRALAVTLAMVPAGKWNIDKGRAVRESLPPAEYLSIPYYQIWVEALETLLVETGVLTPEELRHGQVNTPAPAGVKMLKAADVQPLFSRGWPSTRDIPDSAAFAVGDRVRARQIHPATHTRLPNYCKGKSGTIAALRGTHVFPDTNAIGLGAQPKWLYTVRFEAQELWGADTTASEVYVDFWEPYLTKEEL